MPKSVFDQQGCRALTFALARLSCYICDNLVRHYPILLMLGRNIP